ncbi:Brp/Blh family beta-carotene 15,15'-dioxygenase [Flavobacterium sp.]|jgi:Brp/Blh family beta-carotene 15,15'-monooxygenase|uniref:Brp/Blh family beta-carotene 15,15'-dioxygenase n=1 Tax=Flavobacterium sp. TaxID=239 RepID=UPI0037C114EE
MTNSNNFGIVLSFFGLWITTYFSIEYQQITGFVIIFLFGILHGSNDLLIISKIRSQKVAVTYPKILFYYLVFVSVGILLFYSLPAFALLLFIVISAYHFGEQHWHFLNTKTISKTVIAFQTLYGLFLLAMLFNFHSEEVKTIMEQIIRLPLVQINFNHILLFIGVLLLINSLILYSKSERFGKEIVVNLVYLIVLGIIFKNSNLIWAFAIYFIVWHSLPSMKQQICFLYGHYSFQNFMRYFKAAFVYWLFSLLGILLLYVLFKDKEIFKALFFSFLAAITFPHTLVIMKMQNNNNK